MVRWTFDLEVDGILTLESFDEYPQAAFSVQSARLSAENDPRLTAWDERGVERPSFIGHGVHLVSVGC